MIDKLDLLNHPGILKIARMLKDLDRVKQVRWHTTFRPQVIDTYEQHNVACFRCFVESIEKPNMFLTTLAFVPEALYNANDETLFANTIIKVSDTINTYYTTGDEAILSNKTANNPD